MWHPSGNSESSAQLLVEITKRPDVAARRFQGLAFGVLASLGASSGFCPYFKIGNERKGHVVIPSGLQKMEEWQAIQSSTRLLVSY